METFRLRDDATATLRGSE